MGELTSHRDTRLKPASSLSSKITEGLLGLARVEKVYYSFTTEDGKEISAGNIKVRFISNVRSDEVIVYPYQDSFIDLPLEGELVEVITISTNRYYRRLAIDTEVGRQQLESRTNPLTKDTPQTDISSIRNPSVTSNINRNSINVDKKEGTKYVHRLAVNKGDTLIQSRFGQSIRLGSFQPTNDESNPILLIRNRESSKNETINKSLSVKEDINFDGSTIAMTSGDYISNFTPGTPDDLGKTNFQLDVRNRNPGTTPTYGFEGYPSQLSGDQIIITSDRLIFSSRTAETIFWSKGQAGFITDSIYSVDALKGMTLVSHDGDIDIEAKEKNVNVNVGQNGKIFLGTGEGKVLVPITDGEGLLNLMGEILDEMENLCNGGILTPAGPSSGINPANRAAIASLRNRLTGLQSKTVFVAK